MLVRKTSAINAKCYFSQNFSMRCSHWVNGLPNTNGLNCFSHYGLLRSVKVWILPIKNTMQTNQIPIAKILCLYINIAVIGYIDNKITKCYVS